MEILDLVDENGMPTGETEDRNIIHALGLLHRTSHLWIYRIRDGHAQILLQKRCAWKDAFPGCFDISSAGHIPAGDDYIPSAIRELKEELGIDISPDNIKYCGKKEISFDEVFHGKEFHDRQISGVFLVELNIDEQEFSLQESEVEAVKWFDWEECLKAVKENTIPHCIDLRELQMLSTGDEHLFFPEDII